MALITLSPYSLNSTLDYTFNNVSATGTVTANSLTVSNASGIVNFTNTANVTLGNVSNLHISGGTAGYYLQTDGAGALSWAAGGGGGNGSPGGVNTYIQFNDGGAFGGNAGLVFNKTTTTLTANNFDVTSTANLGSNANVIITGGTNGYVLSTDGAGVLSWVAQSGGGGASIANVNSNVNIPAANGNVNTSVGGVANVFVVTTTGANLSGTLDVTGNISNANVVSANTFLIGGGNLSGANIISANTVTVITVTASGNVSANNFVASANISGANVITANTVTASGNVSANNFVASANISGANVITANTFIGLSAPRVVVITDGASVTMNADTTDIASQTNTQVAGPLAINAVSGTIVNGQKIIFRLQSTNVQTFSWNAIFQGSTDLVLPTVSSGSSKYDYMGFIYNSTAVKWQLIAKNFGF